MNPKPPQGPPQSPQIPESEPVLTFEEFIERKGKYHIITYGNFPVSYFGDNTGKSILSGYKKTFYYKKFETEHPGLAKSLCEKVPRVLSRLMENMDDWGDALKPLEKELYEAYRIMHGYGVSNEVLLA